MGQDINEILNLKENSSKRNVYSRRTSDFSMETSPDLFVNKNYIKSKKRIRIFFFLKKIIFFLFRFKLKILLTFIMIGLLCIFIFPQESGLVISNWINDFLGTIINNIKL